MFLQDRVEEEGVFRLTPVLTGIDLRHPEAGFGTAAGFGMPYRKRRLPLRSRIVPDLGIIFLRRPNSLFGVAGWFIPAMGLQ
jgi:hypothetical protein